MNERVIVLTYAGPECAAPTTWAGSLRLARILCATERDRSTIVDASTGVVIARYPARYPAPYVPRASRLRTKLADRYARA